tara:strand:+ start:103 stop:318 length:216 start_codon:yes stop_codon:yes gene_type:complete
VDDGNGWTEYQRLVIHRLARIEGRLDHIETRLNGLDVNVGQLKLSSKIAAGAIGGVAGLVPAIISLVLTYA